MEENKNLQPEPETSPEDRLDHLLADLLAEQDPEPPSISEEPEDVPAALPEEPEAEPTPIADEGPDILPTLEGDDDLLTFFGLTERDAPATDVEVPTPLEETPAPLEELPPQTDTIPEPETAAETNTETPELEEPAEPEPEQIQPLEDQWIDQIMDTPIVTEEIGVDEQALEAAGLTTLEAAVPDSEEETEDGPAVQPPETIPTLVNTALQQQENLEAKEPAQMAKQTAEAPKEQAPAEEEAYIPRKKIRPRKKGNYGLFSISHIAGVVIWLAIILFVGVGLGNILWEYAADMLAFGREENVVTITILPDDDLDDVAHKLEATGLIKYQGLFKIYGQLADAMEKINPGTYTLNTIYDYKALVDAMAGYVSRVTATVVVPEGYTCAQIFRLLEQKGVCTVAELEEAAANADLGEYWFLEGVERGTPDCLEGYLFPDTYEFYTNEAPVSVLKRFLKNFDKRFNDTMKENLVTLNEMLSEMMRKNGLSEDYIASHQMTVREVVIVASMIEKEAANTAEGFTVASVIYNRLTNPNAYPYLQIDATLVYITGNNNLTAEDLAIDSPYNTYKYSGLIPGPISNPSRASLDAALDPVSSNYHYYALNPATGEHKFSETLAEHEEFLDSLKKNNEESSWQN